LGGGKEECKDNVGRRGEAVLLGSKRGVMEFRTYQHRATRGTCSSNGKTSLKEHCRASIKNMRGKQVAEARHAAFGVCPTQIEAHDMKNKKKQPIEGATAKTRAEKKKNRLSGWWGANHWNNRRRPVSYSTRRKLYPG